MKTLSNHRGYQFIVGISLLIGLLSAIAFAGSILQIPKLISLPAFNMQYGHLNTALASLFASIALFASFNQTRSFRMVTMFLGIAIVLLASCSLIGHYCNLITPLAQLLGDNPYLIRSNPSMPPISAFSFLMVGYIFLTIKSTLRFLTILNEGLLLTVAAVGLTSLFTSILEIPAIGTIPLLDSISIPTSILLIFVTLPLSAQNSSKGFSGFLTSNLTGSKFLRLLLPFVIALPMALGYWLIFIMNRGNVHIEMGVLICCIVCAFGFIIYSTIIAIKLNKGDLHRKNLESSLQKTNQDLMQVKYALDESSLVAITDPKGIITYVNDKFCEISKYDRNELLGSTHSIINSGHHPKEFFASMWKKISSGEVWIGGVKNRAKDGSYYWVHTVIVPFKDQDSKISHYLAIRQDITRLKMLSSQYENLKLKNKEMEQFTYVASHDLQEPLRTVKSMIELIDTLQDEEPKAEVKTAYNFIHQATDRMSNLIKALLDYSRIGSLKQLRQVDSSELINQVVQDLDGLIKRTGAKIFVSENLPSLKVYEVEFRLLMQNLISNAIKFQTAGNIPEINITVKKRGADWQFSVSDNGIGIEDIHNRGIFGIFKRLHNRSEYEGTGIGLAHSEKIAHLHGGEIWVDSTPGEGSTFNFTISQNLN